MTELAFEAGALAAIWGGWEMAKATGLVNVLRGKLFGGYTLSKEERKTALDHYESCRGCAKHQEKQEELLQDIRDATIEIKTYITAIR